MSILGRVNLSNENYEGPMVDATEAIIEGDLAYADAMELAQEAKLDAQAMMTLEDATQALEAKISNEEYLLANPEKITTEVVALANESYAVVAHILGASEAEMEGMLSNESIDSSPVSAMNISHEGVKDFLTKLYDSIKLLFKKIGNAIKKIVVKLVVAMNGVEKAAKKLKEKLTKSSEKTAKETKLKDKDAKVWNKYFQAIAAATGESTANDGAGKLLEFYTSTLKSNLNGISSAIITFSGEILAIKDITDNDAKSGEDSQKTKYEAAVNAFATEAKKLLDNGSGSNKKFDLESDEYLLPVSYVNDKAKGLIVSIEDGKNDNTKELKFKVGTISVVKDAIESDNVDVMEKQTLTTLIGKIESAAKGLKKFSDDRIKEIDNMYKELDKQAEKKTSNAISKFMLKQKASFGTNVRALVAGVYLDSVLGYSTATKKVLAFCRDHAEMYKANEL